MDKRKITELSVKETITGLEEKQFSEAELNQAYLDRINALNSKLNIFLEVQTTNKGIPAAIKDVISTKDIKTTAGSKILENYLPPYNATVIDRLLKHNISIVGKTNCDEFAMGSSGENSAFGPTKNPWDLTKVSGGSSSGAAAAVSVDLCAFAIGTDTGGSIRMPASFCGVVGLRPSYGRVSRYGVIPMASSFDQVGPLTKTVADARLVLDWISGSDEYDSNCCQEKFMINDLRFKNNLAGLRIGIPKEFFSQGLDNGVEEVVKEAIRKIEQLGATIVEIELPHTEYAIATYYILVPSEVSSNLARFDGIRYGYGRDKFGAETKRRIMLGTYALSSGYYDDYYAKAAKVRTLIMQDFKKAFNTPAHSGLSFSGSKTGGVDVIVGPVSPTVAWNLGEKVNDPLKMYLSDIYTVPSNLAGLPAISVPCGFSGGLPVGLQIIGKYLDEATILDVAEVYEQNTTWQDIKPNLQV